MNIDQSESSEPQVLAGAPISEACPQRPVSILVSGEPGSGKTVAILQMLAHWREQARRLGESAPNSAIICFDSSGALLGVTPPAPDQPSTRLADYIEEEIIIYDRTGADDPSCRLPVSDEWEPHVQILNFSRLDPNRQAWAARRALNHIRTARGLEEIIVAIEDARVLDENGQNILAGLLHREGGPRILAVVPINGDLNELHPALANSFDFILAMTHRNHRERILNKWPALRELRPGSNGQTRLANGMGYFAGDETGLRATSVFEDLNMEGSAYPEK